MSRLIIGPFNRVEGDLEVRLDIRGGMVASAEVVSPLFRGFERMLVGKPALDALVYAPRICGICSVSQSVAAAAALRNVRQQQLPPNGEAAVHLIHAIENVADHLTHFYLFFMPDFARSAYAGEAWYDAAACRFRAMSGTALANVLPARTGLLAMLGILAGKWPHTLAIQPAGSTRAINLAEKARLGAMLAEWRRFLETTLFDDRLEHVAALTNDGALRDWAGLHNGDMAHFLRLSSTLNLAALGRTSVRHMSYGAYHSAQGPLFAAGVFQGRIQPLDPARITEDVSHGWYLPDAPRHPASGATTPDATCERAYSWCKAPRLDGAPVEVGALSRQLVAGHPLLRDLAARDGANVENRVVARLIEAARVTMAMEGWLAAITPGEPFITPGHLPDAGAETGTGAGLTEAARGSLGHWLRLVDGRIDHYQIIAPTTWNFSPRDAAGVPGPLEQALAGTPVRVGEAEPVAVQHIVRSFDPCMVCTVH